ncbi:unnamed protein product, partial [Iphiclides podalirius]
MISIYPKNREPSLNSLFVRQTLCRHSRFTREIIFDHNYLIIVKRCKNKQKHVKAVKSRVNLQQFAIFSWLCVEKMSAGEPRVQLDEVLGQLGAFGRHQLITMCMLALVYATNSIYNVNYVFAVEDVSYRCVVPECEPSRPPFPAPWVNLSSSENGIKQCRRHPPLTPLCEGLNTSAEYECAEWVYDVPHSFVAEFGLACEDWKPPLVGTVHMFGNMVGLLLQGQISDRFGRKTAAVFAGTMGAILGLTKSFANTFWMYIIIEGLEAAIGDALSPMFMLSIEIVEKKRAVFFQMILLNCYTGGLIIMPFIAWAVPYWRHFLRVIYAPTLIILTYSFFLDESIRWLHSKGQTERAIKIIEKIANRNNVQVDKMLLNKLDYINEDSSPNINDRKLLLKTFRSKIMMQRFLVCLVWWFTITLINYGMMISSVLIDGNKYVNFALLMLMDIPANVFYWLALSKYRRKLPLLASFTIGGLFCISQPFVPKGYAWAGLALFMMFEMLATFSYNIVYMYTSELFPTYTRNSMHAICSAVGRVGSLLAPQTPLLMAYWSGLPAVIFGMTSLASGALTLLMPETASCQLPDTVREAETIGQKVLLKPEEHELKGWLIRRRQRVGPYLWYNRRDRTSIREERRGRQIKKWSRLVVVAPEPLKTHYPPIVHAAAVHRLVYRIEANGRWCSVTGLATNNWQLAIGEAKSIDSSRRAFRCCPAINESYDPLRSI